MMMEPNNETYVNICRFVGQLGVEDVKDEFTEYLNLHPLSLAVNTIMTLSGYHLQLMSSYFVQRMP